MARKRRKWCALDGRFTETTAIVELGDRYGAAAISIPVVLLNLATQEEWAGGRESGEFRAVVSRVAIQARTDDQTVQEVIEALVDSYGLLERVTDHPLAPVLCWVNWLEWGTEAQRQQAAVRKQNQRDRVNVTPKA